MTVETHQINELRIAEVISDKLVIASTEDGLDLLGNLYYQGFDRIMINEKNITQDFFDLKTGIAGEILQKFSNYRMGLAIIGNFDSHPSKSFRDFVFESNKLGLINFVNSREEAISRFSSKR
ncbi:DUF4180 domain-containing protein [Dyadobacter sp. LHD-138]|uniref:DUF4180 domain-containing protein n=1 Tax=Dyadobacter sp. LHD-138 TaxID=3071413 RepID=UPI0027DEE9A5|nr:DUF4180 domain-containing protein [Dyadobacter sp. LHD-138]MDQ6479437.1 DUF4180 domain-containing protein [Dyadobacter sp. LHD-138]